MNKVAIDGDRGQGRYTVECICGDTWGGVAEKRLGIGYSPALPIAESVVHVRLEHPDLMLDLRFSESFQNWLEEYWQWFNFRVIAGAVADTTTFGVSVR